MEIDGGEGKVEFMDILTRYQRLSGLYRKYGLMEEANWCQKRATFVFDSCTLNKKKDVSNNKNGDDSQMNDSNDDEGDIVLSFE